MSIWQPWLANPCPKCGAKAGERCRSLTTRRVTDTHVARETAQLQPPPP